MTDDLTKYVDVAFPDRVSPITSRQRVNDAILLAITERTASLKADITEAEKLILALSSTLSGFVKSYVSVCESDNSGLLWPLTDEEKEEISQAISLVEKGLDF